MDGAYADESEGLRKEIMPAATMYARVAGETVESVIDSIDQHIIGGMKTEIDTVLNTANSEQFRAALQTITKEFNANAIANYSEVLK
jgi:hypothetical protein